MSSSRLAGEHNRVEGFKGIVDVPCNMMDVDVFVKVSRGALSC